MTWIILGAALAGLLTMLAQHRRRDSRQLLAEMIEAEQQALERRSR